MSNWLTSLSSMLSHTGQVRRSFKNAFGAVSSVTTVATVAMYAYQEDRERQVIETRLTGTFDWTIILSNSLADFVRTDDQIVDVIDPNGRTVVAAGVIKELQEFNHWSEQLQFFVAGVNRN